MANHCVANCPLAIPERAFRAWIRFDLERSLNGAFTLRDDGSLLLEPKEGDPEGDPVVFPASLLFLNGRGRPESRYPNFTSQAWMASFLLESAGLAFGARVATDEGIGRMALAPSSPAFGGLYGFFRDVHPSSAGSDLFEMHYRSEARQLLLLGYGREKALGSDPSGGELAPWRGSAGFADYLERHLPDPSGKEADALLLAFASLPGDPIPESLLEKASPRGKEIAFGCAIRSGQEEKAKELAAWAGSLDEKGMEKCLRRLKGPAEDMNRPGPEQDADIARAKAAFEAVRLAAQVPEAAARKPPKRF